MLSKFRLVGNRWCRSLWKCKQNKNVSLSIPKLNIRISNHLWMHFNEKQAKYSHLPPSTQAASIKVVCPKTIKNRMTKILLSNLPSWHPVEGRGAMSWLHNLISRKNETKRRDLLPIFLSIMSTEWINWRFSVYNFAVRIYTSTGYCGSAAIFMPTLIAWMW